MIEIKVEGLKETLEDIERIRAQFSPEIYRATQRSLIWIELFAKKKAPVDTDRLRSSITHRVTAESHGFTGITGTNVKYARYQEFGFKKHLAYVGPWAGRHGFKKGTKFLFVSKPYNPQGYFMRPAAVESLDRIKMEFQKGIENVLANRSTS